MNHSCAKLTHSCISACIIAKHIYQTNYGKTPKLGQNNEQHAKHIYKTNYGKTPKLGQNNEQHTKHMKTNKGTSMICEAPASENQHFHGCRKHCR